MIQNCPLFFWLLATVASTGTYPEIKHFTISNCLKDCPKRCGIISSEENENEFHLKFGAYFNCILSAEDSVEAKYYDDTLRIQVWHPDKITYTRGDTLIEQTEKGQIITIKSPIITRYSESAGCYCYYEIELSLEKLHKQPTAYLVNGKTFDEHIQFGNMFQKK
jgi:hypothetical protein